MLGAGTVLRYTVKGTQNQHPCHSNGMVYGWYSHSRTFLELHSHPAATMPACLTAIPFPQAAQRVSRACLGLHSPIGTRRESILV